MRYLCAAFLTALQAEGRAMGVADYQQVQELLTRLPANTAPKRLGQSLVALFAHSAAEQKQQLALFALKLKEWQALEEVGRDESDPDPDPGQARRDRRPIYIVGALLLALLSVVAWNMMRPKVYQGDPLELKATAGEKMVLPLPSDSASSIAIDASQLPDLPDPESEDKPKLGQLAKTKTNISYSPYQLASTEIDSFLLVYHTQSGDRLEQKFLVTISPKQRQTIREDSSRTTAEPSALSYEPQPLPHNRSISRLSPVPEDPYSARAILRRWWPLAALLATGLLGVLYYYIQRYRHRRRMRLVARRDSTLGAPHFWRIVLPQVSSLLDFGEGYELLLKRLRQRTSDSARELDLAATVEATIQTGGLPDFKYRGRTRPAEYLLLIDRGSADNHRAQLFDQLYQRLAAEEVLIERYFYDGDPRLLYSENRSQGQTLQQLHQRFPNARLLLVGTGDRLLSISSGRLNKWARQQFGRWKDRSLLSPRPTQQWGRRERRLSELFPLVPASMQGLQLLINRFSSGADMVNIDFRQLIDDASLEEITFQGDLLTSLERAFPQLIDRQWIAACALYPALHWDLTLYLGQYLSEQSGESLLTSRRILELCRLPWFNEGQMPEAARIELVEWLERDHPTLMSELRAALLTALEQAELPPENSVAQRDLDFLRQQNEWLLAAPGSEKRKQVGRQIAEQIEAGQEPDGTVLKYLAQPGPLDVVLPDRFKNKIYPGGYPALGWREALKPFRLNFSLHPFALLAIAAFSLGILLNLTENGRLGFNLSKKEYLLVKDNLQDSLPVYWVKLDVSSAEDMLAFYEHKLMNGIDTVSSLSNDIELDRIEAALLNVSSMSSAYLDSLAEIYPYLSTTRNYPSYLWIPFGELNYNDNTIRSLGSFFNSSPGIAGLNLYVQPIDTLAEGKSGYYDKTELSVEAIQNLAAKIFNRGLTLRDRSRTVDVKSCGFYELAYRLNSTNTRYRQFVNLCQQGSGAEISLDRPFYCASNDCGDRSVFFSLSNGNICAGQSVQLSYMGSGGYDLLRIDWGDGTIDSLRSANTSHTYAGSESSEAYTINASAIWTCSEGTSCSSTVLPVSISGVPTINPIPAGCAPYVVNFSTSDAGIVAHSWAFGDGTSSIDVSPTYVFNMPGVYTVALNYQNFCGATGRVFTEVEVLPPNSEVCQTTETQQNPSEFPQNLPPATIPFDVPEEVLEDTIITPGDNLSAGDGPIFPTMIEIEGATFTMGNTFDPDEGYDNELPKHQVTLSPYALGRTEVTNAEFVRFLNAKGNQEQGGVSWYDIESVNAQIKTIDQDSFYVEPRFEQHPVGYISWYGATQYCNWLSEQDPNLSPVYTFKDEEVNANWQANGYRLPTEAEWEYAASISYEPGRKSRFGNGLDTAREKQINFNASDYAKKDYSEVGFVRINTVPVASLKLPNPKGFHDLSGNVQEWCWDLFTFYSEHAVSNPTGTDGSFFRILRGGSLNYGPQYCRASHRSNKRPSDRDDDVGFRLARSY